MKSKTYRVAGKNIYYYEELDSTNLEAKRLAVGSDSDDIVVISDKQTSGRGRSGKNWTSPAGTGIWMSLIVRPDIKPENASQLTLVIALAVQETIQKVTGLKTYIKWPNDIIVNGKKVCGILTEMSSQEGRIHYVVIGVGVNVNTADFPKEIDQVATSLFLEGKNEYNRDALIEMILEHFNHNYNVFLETADLSGLVQQYNEALINKDQKVRVVEKDNSFTGISIGINSSGELLVKKEDEIIKIISGEVSVRGLFGYVD